MNITIALKHVRIVIKEPYGNESWLKNAILIHTCMAKLTNIYFSMQIMEYLVKNVFPNAKRLTVEEAPGIIACVEEIARKAGSSAPPLYLDPSNNFNAAIYPLGRSMIINQGALDATGSKLHGIPSGQMEAILAHEMGHWSNGLRHFGPIFTIISAAGMIGSASVFLYERTHKKQKKDGTISLQTFNSGVDEMAGQKFWQPVRENARSHRHPVFSIAAATDTTSGSLGDYIKTQIIGITAGAASLAIASPLTRQFALRNEFEADAFAVKITGKPEVYIEMLNNLHSQLHESAESMAKRLNNKSAAEKIIESAKGWFNSFLQNTLMAHPSWEERVAAIRKLAPAITHIT